MNGPHLVGDIGSFTGLRVELDKPRVVIGRDKASCDIVLSQAFISKCHAAFETAPSGSTTVRDLGSKFGTFVNGRRVLEHPLSQGDRVGFGPEGMIAFRYSADERADASTASAVTTDGASTLHIATKPALDIGRAHDNDIVLEAAGVSRRHARLTFGEDSRPVLADLGSTNGTYVNGELLREPRALEPDDLIFLGGFLFRVNGRTLRRIDLSASRIRALDLSKQIKGQPVMQNISFAVLPGEFVGLMGPSGCGKSTLMDALDGLQPAQTGSVFLGELDLYRNFDAVRRSIGHVPQHDILHDDLTVERTLVYAARLRLPATTTRSALRATVADIVETVSLQDKLGTTFRNLSGGQQKRLSIAIELITKPTFLFLDEPTSPLDPETTEDLMHRFRLLADQGRIVVMITHKFERFELMDQVAFLTRGGRLAFFGPPRAALEYFQCGEPAEIFRRMQPVPPEELNRKFAASPQYRRYVERRIAESSALGHATRHPSAAAPAPRARPSVRDQLNQWWTLTQRFSEIKLNDRRNTVLLLVQSPVIALILVLISGNAKNDAKTLFITAVIAVWFGANNAIREIVAEFPIYRRERRFGLGIPAYVLSKFTVLSGIGLVQSAAFLAILSGSGLLEPRDFLPLLAILYLTTLGGVSMALFFSAIVNSAEKALSILPLLLIPQLLLSGYLKPVDDIYLNLANGKPVASAVHDGEGGGPPAAGRIEKREGLGAARLLSVPVLARWSIDGFVHAVGTNDDKSRDKLASQVSVAGYEAVLDNGDEAAVTAAYRHRFWLDLAILIVFSVGFLPLTVWALARRDVL